MKKALILLALSILTMAGCAYPGDQSKKEIIIASANPMTGNSSDYGDMKVKG